MKRRLAICAAVGLLMTALPLALLMLIPAKGAGGVPERILSVIAGPGVSVSQPLFGVHNLGFFVTTPIVNFLFWSAVGFVVLGLYARLAHANR